MLHVVKVRCAKGRGGRPQQERTGTGRAHEAKRLPSRDGEGHVLEHWVAGGVLERDIAELNCMVGGYEGLGIRLVLHVAYSAAVEGERRDTERNTASPRASDLSWLGHPPARYVMIREHYARLWVCLCPGPTPLAPWKAERQRNYDMASMSLTTSCQLPDDTTHRHSLPSLSP